MCALQTSCWPPARPVGREGERWWVFIVVTIFIEFFRLNANRYIDSTCQGLVSEPLLNYVVRWKGFHIRPITGIGVFGDSTIYLFKNTMLSILFATGFCGLVLTQFSLMIAKFPFYQDFNFQNA